MIFYLVDVKRLRNTCSSVTCTYCFKLYNIIMCVLARQCNIKIISFRRRSLAVRVYACIIHTTVIAGASRLHALRSRASFGRSVGRSRPFVTRGGKIAFCRWRVDFGTRAIVCFVRAFSPKR